MKRHTKSTLGSGIFLIVMTGCTTVPVEQVELYTQAFNEASAAGNRLYDEVSSVIIKTQAEAAEGSEPSSAHQVASATAVPIAAAGERSPSSLGPADCPRPTETPTPFAPCFDPSSFLTGYAPGEPESLLARRRALETIATFNSIALRLASGESANALGAEVQQLGAKISSLAALTGAGAGVAPISAVATQAVTKLAIWAETLRADQELRRALTDASPLIQQLLQALIEDTPRMYAFKREETKENLKDIKADVQRASMDVQDIVRQHAAFPGLERYSQRYGAARDRIHGLPFKPLTAMAGSAGTDPLGVGDAAEIDKLTARIESLADEYIARLESLNRYYDALGEYVAMLQRVSESLEAVAAAARAPQAITISPTVLAQQATEIRDLAGQIERLLSS